MLINLTKYAINETQETFMFILDNKKRKKSPKSASKKIENIVAGDTSIKRALSAEKSWNIDTRRHSKD
uniref:Uncharacterized protein n=1 Tax=Romanomermis culicivorax TaxID=13658 RepID=A0A915KUQ3_ROMCU